MINTIEKTDQILNGIGTVERNPAVSAAREVGSNKEVRENAGSSVVKDDFESATALLKDYTSLDASYNAAAKSIRTVDKVMNAIDGTLVEMSETLDRIVKNYPPFPLGDPERENILRNYISLRKQIDEMTIPPNDDIAAQIMKKDETGIEGVNIGERRSGFMLHRREVHTGTAGIDVPVLNKESTDEEIAGVVEKLGLSKSKLEEKRKALEMEAKEVMETYGNVGSRFEGIFKRIFTDDFGELSENEAKQRSEELSHLMKEKERGSLMGMRSGFLSLVR